MPKGLSNWGYRDVVDFLRLHRFTPYKTVIGSHEQWLSEDGKSIVDINFIQGSESYRERTLESMIRDALPSGLDKKHWRKWAETGGYCCKPEKEGEKEEK